MWNGISPAISINKDVTVISDFKLPNLKEDSPKGTQGLRSSRHCQGPVVIAEGGGGGGGAVGFEKSEKQDLALDS